jgi:hypothetical protein
MLSNLHMPRINATKAPALLADVWCGMNNGK